MQEKRDNKNIIIGIICAVFAALLSFLSIGILPLALLLVMLPAVAFYGDMKSRYPIASITLIISWIILCIMYWSSIYIMLPIIICICILPIVCYILFFIFKDLSFYESVIYTIAAALISVMIGVLIIFLINARGDLIEMYQQSIYDYLISAKENSFFDALLPGFSSAILFLENAVDFNEFFAYSASTIDFSREAHLEIIVPYMKDVLGLYGVSYFMSFALLIGIFTWYIPTLIYYRMVKWDVKGPKLKPPPITSFRMPKWFTNTIMLMLVFVIFIQYAGSERWNSVAMAIQKIIMLLLAFQGISTIAWLLKRYKVHKTLRAVILIIICFLSSLMAWIGIFDVVFNIRLYSANREMIRKTLYIMKKNYDKEKNSKKHKDIDNSDKDNDDERKDEK